MPIRPMKEGSEQHLVIKAQVRNPMNPVPKAPKASHNGKGPPLFDRQDSHLQNLNPSPVKNRRRRSRGVKKNGLCDEVFCLRSSVADCHRILDGSLENEGSLCGSEVGSSFSSKSLRFPARPCFGQLGTRVIVKANHFFTELPEKDLIHYDVNITPEVNSKIICRSVIVELVRLYRNLIWG
ncbi:hypothetical protein HPP92_009401 [Vanilla planifolia]|uniref:Uncharacterized protein n=1 Tax=Vanilla planifolia TaxID=51239 RepID=A0A835RDT8_VANPL|nr:hypothetical protein HPP92_009401 [Vanilla planifolia]